MIRTENICLTFGDQTIFNNISFTFQNNQRIGLIGRNGSGKTTLLKLISGMISLENGLITKSNNQTIAYMPQQVVLRSDKTVFQEGYSTFKTMYTLEKRYQELEKTLEINSTCTKTIEEIAVISQELQEQNTLQARLKTKTVLKGLGFNDQQLTAKVETLSVGWKMRIVLAKLLLQDADFYLFDEPTNHLDIFAKDWFLSFLKEASFGFLLVCHERYLLDALCSHIFELENGNGTLYQGSYSDYEKQKKQNLEALKIAHNQQQREITRKQAIINKFRAKASKAKMAKSMERALSKIERIELPESTTKTIAFNLIPRKRSGRIVLSVKNVAHAFGTKEIFKNVSFDVEREQKIAIVAPNGVGKTTLFNLIAKIYPIKTGNLEFGYNVEYALFHQDQDAVLNKESTIFKEVCDYAPHKTIQEIRTFLGCFLFSKDTIDKKIKVLSGGEKNRVSLVKILLQDANLLLLDEPTNHLDIQSKTILLKALQEYQGTILFVSHDHDFINHLATHIIELTPQGTRLFPGNYTDYLHQKKHINTSETEIQQLSTPQSSNQTTAKAQYHLKKESKKLEQKITKLDQAISKEQKVFAQLHYGTPDYKKAVQQLQELESSYKKIMHLWETIQQKLLKNGP